MGKTFLKLTLHCIRGSKAPDEKNIEIFYPCRAKSSIFEIDINKIEKWACQTGYYDYTSNVVIKKIDFTQIVHLNDDEIKKYSGMKRIYNGR